MGHHCPALFHRVCLCIQENPPSRRTSATPQLAVQPQEIEPTHWLRHGPHPITHGLQVGTRQPASAEGADGGAAARLVAELGSGNFWLEG